MDKKITLFSFDIFEKGKNLNKIWGMEVNSKYNNEISFQREREREREKERELNFVLSP